MRRGTDVANSLVVIRVPSRWDATRVLARSVVSFSSGIGIVGISFWELAVGSGNNRRRDLQFRKGPGEFSHSDPELCGI